MSEEKVCGICLNKLSSEGKLDNCHHPFHFRCIYKWSKLSNFCPTCRKPFTSIKHYRKRQLLKSVPVFAKNPEFSSEEESEEEAYQTCCFCHEERSQQAMVSCDTENCLRQFHLSCLPDSSSAREWLCPECINKEVHEEVDSGCSSEDFEEEEDEFDVHIVSDESSEWDWEVGEEQVSDPEADYSPEDSQSETEALPPRKRLHKSSSNITTRKRLKKMSTFPQTAES